MGAEVMGSVDFRPKMEADRAEAILRADRVAGRVRSLVRGITLLWYALGIPLRVFCRPVLYLGRGLYPGPGARLLGLSRCLASGWARRNAG